MSERLHNDVDPIETRDWLQAIESVIREEGVERAQYLIDQLLSEARKGGVKVAAGASAGNYVNTIAVEDEPEYPGNLDLERRIRSAIRWNAIMTVLRASKKDLELGGHMASYQSSATFYEVCFNHFFRARTEKDGGDLVYFRGHISPGVYARAFPGRPSDRRADGQLPSGSSRQGPVLLSAPETDAGILAVPDRIHGAGAVGRYLSGQIPEISGTPRSERHLRTNRLRLLGDGEMDEPESKGAITIATREKLDNWSSSSTATCSVWTARSPVTAKSLTNWKASSVVLAGTLSRLSGAAVGMSCCVKTPAVS